MAHLTQSRIRSGAQLDNIHDLDVFTYFGDGTTAHPDNIADMDTLLWLLKVKS